MPRVREKEKPAFTTCTLQSRDLGTEIIAISSSNHFLLTMMAEPRIFRYAINEILRETGDREKVTKLKTWSKIESRT